MIRVFVLPEYSQIKVASLEDIENLAEIRDNITWIDLQNPSAEQIQEIEKFYKISFPTKQQQEEIETSSRYLENSGVIKINSTFINISNSGARLDENEISFIITKTTLLTLRYFDSRVMSEAVKKVKQFPIGLILQD